MRAQYFHDNLHQFPGYTKEGAVRRRKPVLPDLDSLLLYLGDHDVLNKRWEGLIQLTDNVGQWNVTPCDSVAFNRRILRCVTVSNSQVIRPFGFLWRNVVVEVLNWIHPDDCIIWL